MLYDREYDKEYEYPYYVINSRTHAILGAAISKQDAFDLEQNMPLGYITKILGRVDCIRQGIDLSASNWSNYAGDDVRYWPQEWG